MSDDSFSDDFPDIPIPGTAAGEAIIRDILATAEDFEIPMDLDPAQKLELNLALRRRNDMGNAERMVVRFGSRLVYVREVGWLVWAGTHWERTAGDVAARRYAHQAAVALQHEARILEKRGAFADEKKADYEKRIDRARKWATACGNSNRLSAMLTEAAAMLSIEPDDLDTHPRLLSVANGTLELAGPGRITLRGHAPADRITRACGVAYDPDADCVQWERFLERILPDPDVRGFVQRYAGYSLTGEIGEQSLILLHGKGANGKSVFVNALAYVLGGYAMSLPFASLLHDDRKRGSEASPDLARLPGARMVAASEPDVGVRISESVVKSLTGGEPIAVRQLHKDFFEFLPQFKLMLSFNNSPQVRGQDEGVWRRILMVPFEVTIPREERDPRLLKWGADSDNPLKAEASGILNWMLDGFEQWAEAGLQPPPAVVAATEDYRSDQDPVRQFVNLACKRVESERIQSSRLYAAYQKWCRENAIDAKSHNAFGRALGDMGIKKETVGKVFYVGLELLPEFEPNDGLPEERG